jgi:hypothetical protein
LFARKVTKLKQTNQEQNTFNSLRINIIKVTFFDGKDAIFVIKDATCKKCEKSLANTPRVNHLDFWEDFAQESALSAAPKSQSATTQQGCMSCM